MGHQITVRIGHVNVGLSTAKRWVHEYTDPASISTSRPFAFPAYDRMATGSGPSELNDGDLLAPVLLSVTPKLAAFYALQAMRPDLVSKAACHNSATNRFRA